MVDLTPASLRDAEPVMTMRGVTRRFGTQSVLNGVDLSLYEGETLALIGASGSGKSVALRIMCGLMAPDQGVIRYRGRDLDELSAGEMIALRRKVAYVFQEDALFDSMTVLENVGYALYEHTKQGDAEIIARAWECLELVGLGRTERPEILDMMPANLSGGMRRRVALARAVALVPKVILYDEPMGGLDPANCRRIADMVKSMQTRYGLASVVVTHHLPSVWRIADRVAFLRGGRIAHVGPTAEFRAIDDPALQHFISTDMGLPPPRRRHAAAPDPR